MRIGIVGSRRRNKPKDKRAVEKALQAILKRNRNITIVSGGCPQGGDRFAEELAKKYELTITIFRAKWKKYGRIAGFKRNTHIAKRSDILIACVAKDRKGGTEDTIKKFLKKSDSSNLKLV